MEPLTGDIGENTGQFRCGTMNPVPGHRGRGAGNAIVPSFRRIPPSPARPKLRTTNFVPIGKRPPARAAPLGRHWPRQCPRQPLSRSCTLGRRADPGALGRGGLRRRRRLTSRLLFAGIRRRRVATPRAWMLERLAIAPAAEAAPIAGEFRALVYRPTMIAFM